MADTTIYAVAMRGHGDSDPRGKPTMGLLAGTDPVAAAARVAGVPVRRVALLASYDSDSLWVFPVVDGDDKETGRHLVVWEVF
jgi:hypothetical protein